ncbi:MAG: zinc-binding dehydrogenase, partial [Elusimicrobiota bacterium]
MKAVLLKACGGPENLSWEEVPDLVPGPGEALVRVRACSLNHLDLWVREGIPAYRITLPHVLGSDIAGELAALGPGSQGPALGSRVLVCPGRSCWECDHCLSGRDNICSGYGILGANGGWGGYAQYARVPARSLLPIPAGIGFAEAAAFPLTFLTAWHMLLSLARLTPGQTLLVFGAGSGVGVAAIQIAKLAGARVIAVSTSEEKLERAKSLGADETQLSGPGLHRRVLQSTGTGVDAVFEHVGPAVFPEALRCLKPGGILVTCGATTGPVAELDLRYVFSRELRIAGARMGTLAELRTLVGLLAERKLKPVVDRTFPLSEAAQAQKHLAERRQFGKV